MNERLRLPSLQKWLELREANKMNPKHHTVLFLQIHCLLGREAIRTGHGRDVPLRQMLDFIPENHSSDFILAEIDL